jgi:8-oxo-dGTP diphosphatase
MACKWIQKVGLAAISDGRLLVARKRNSEIFILPGGKPEGSETDLETLKREVDEELGCTIANPILRGVFKDVAAGDSGAVVVVRLYSADIVGDPKPCSEIEELAWIDLMAPKGVTLAPSIQNGILPYLRRRSKSVAGGATQPADELVQGLLELV